MLGLAVLAALPISGSNTLSVNSRLHHSRNSRTRSTTRRPAAQVGRSTGGEGVHHKTSWHTQEGGELWTE